MGLDPAMDAKGLLFPPAISSPANPQSFLRHPVDGMIANAAHVADAGSDWMFVSDGREITGPVALQAPVVDLKGSFHAIVI